ncbi:MAG TPA: septal ring lytic transglycosylase RlpA family lipoprotein [Gammaproteobacteria bacterium]|nr:septal ring lytic transglycosylase RlpA family lipoprotein [Gammaproteobacteria bacterium]
MPIKPGPEIDLAGARPGRAAFGRGGAVLLGLLLTACGQLPHQPVHNAPLTPSASGASSQYPDAVPRVEPRSRLGNPPYYVVNGRRYVVLDSAKGFYERGIASWYGPDFHGKSASSGERYDMYAMTAAHKTLPLPSYVRVTNLENGRSAVVRVNDRGPFVGNRVIDLSFAAATRLGIVQQGTAPVEVVAIEPAEAGAVIANAGPRAVAGKPRFYLQTGAFSQRENAERMRRLFLLARLGPVDIRSEPNGFQTVHKVWIGPFDDVSALDMASAKLEDLGIHDSRPTID